MGRIVTRTFFKKIVLLAPVTLVVMLNQACQSNSYRQQNLVAQDVKRISHARELLAQRYKGSAAKQFEGDHRLFSYIEKYIQDENPNLDSAELTATLLEVSLIHGYDPVFLLAVIKTESQFKPDQIGAAGEIGLMQVKPSTAEWICNKNKIKWEGAERLKDPHYNIVVGAHYFSYLRKTHDAKNFKYINAYNMGPKSLKRLPASSQKKHPYMGKVMANYRDIYSELKKFKQNI